MTCSPSLSSHHSVSRTFPALFPRTCPSWEGKGLWVHGPLRDWYFHLDPLDLNLCTANIMNLNVFSRILRWMTMARNFLFIICLNAVTSPAVLQSTGNSSVFNELSKMIDNGSVIVWATSFRTFGVNIMYHSFNTYLAPLRIFFPIVSSHSVRRKLSACFSHLNLPSF